MAVQELAIIVDYRATRSAASRVGEPHSVTVHRIIDARQKCGHGTVNVIRPAECAHDALFTFGIALFRGQNLQIGGCARYLWPAGNCFPVCVCTQHHIRRCQRAGSQSSMIHILSIRTATGPVHQAFRLESSRVCVLDADIACQPPRDRLVLIGANTTIQRDHHAQPGLVCAVLAGTVYTVADHHLVTRRDDVIRFPSGDIIEIQRNDIPELHCAGLSPPTNELTTDNAAHIFQVRLLSLGHGAIGRE